MIRVGIVGGAGYVGGELIRLLLRHPAIQISFVQSNSQAGQPLWAVHPDLAGETQLLFAAAATTEIDLLFLCTGHGRARSFLAEYPAPPELKIIDLSRDYRLADMAEDFVYGLPELNRTAIKTARRIANPGCFATAIQLGLLPLAAAGRLPGRVHVHALTGSTGAGQRPGGTTHFSWRINNVSIYKPFVHQHLDEIYQSLRQLQPRRTRLDFLPLRGNFSRGIFASLYLDWTEPEATARTLYEQFYRDHPFVHLLPGLPDLKPVVNTNKCLLSVQKHVDRLLVVSTIDNLLKGAAGQAVQNMNLLFGLAETTGLHLKATGF